jgi:hypothetical protein
MTARAWNQNLRLWLLPAVFFLLMVAFLTLFGLKFADEAQVARNRLARRTEELDTMRAQRELVEGTVGRIRASEEGLADFYGRRLSSESQALTRIIAEIKDLCDRAGIPPTSLSYEKQSLEGQDVFRRTITFAVNGSYAQLRQLINFIELSDSFLILDQVGLRGNDVEGTQLRISLRLSTLFALTVPPEDGAPPGPVS